MFAPGEPEAGGESATGPGGQEAACAPRPPAPPAPAAPDGTQIGGWAFDPRTREVRWSKEMFAIHGLAPQERITLEQILETVYPEDLELVGADMADWPERVAPFSSRPRIIRPDGEVRQTEVHGWADALAPAGEVRIVGTARDITDELGRSSSSDGGVCGLNEAGEIVFCDAAFRRMMGGELAQLRGRSLHELGHGSQRAAHPAQACPYLPPFASPGGSDPALRRLDGDVLAVSFTATVVSGPPHPGVLLSFQRNPAERAIAGESATGAAFSLAAAEEQERLRSAHQLHEDAIGSLYAIALGLDLGDAEGPRLGEAAAQIRRVADRLQQVVLELMPPALPGALPDAVRDYCEVLLGDAGIAFEVNARPASFSDEETLLAYRLLQHALRDVAAHGRARSVVIDLQRDPGQIMLRVQTEQPGRSRGGEARLGERASMHVLRWRVEAAGGAMTTESTADGRRGLIVMTLPVTRAGS